MKHLSWYGGTCWFCGHPAGGEERRTKTLAGVTYRSCHSCWLVKAETKEEIIRRRDADVAGLESENPDYVPVYWSPAGLCQLWHNYQGYPPSVFKLLLCKPWQDDSAETTKQWDLVKRREYAKNFYAKGGGREARNEAARVKYAQKKAQRELDIKLIENLLGEQNGTE